MKHIKQVPSKELRTDQRSGGGGVGDGTAVLWCCAPEGGFASLPVF